jgi:diadenylate cyclase
VIALPQAWSWLLQLALASGVIYLFLLIARQSRGNRVVRALVTGGTTAVVALWGLTETLALVELQHLLSSVTGFVVVVLAIVFQPELRRALGQLARLGASMSGRALEVAAIAEIAAAAQSMARRRRGALVSFERETSLDPWIERGVTIDARIDRHLVESLFEPSGALHDGGVVVRGDRIVAASCVFPLTESQGLAQQYGTRHRAAIGLSEETDSVTLVVSEETGRISIANDGKLIGPIAAADLESELAAALGFGGSTAKPAAPDSLFARAAALARHVVRDGYWVAVSTVLAAGLLYVAHEQVAFEDDVRFELVAARAADIDSTDPAVRERLVARPGRILVVLEPTTHDFSGEDLPRELDLVVSGSRSSIERFRREAAGELRVTNTADPVVLEPALLDWNTDTLGLGLRWRVDRPTRLTFLRVGGREFELTAAMLPIGAGAVLPSIAVDPVRTAFHPPRVMLDGPVETLDVIASEGSGALFAPLELGKEPVPDARYPLVLAERWTSAGVRLSTAVEAQPLVSRSRRTWTLGDVEIAVVCMDPERAEELEGWSLAASNQTARFQVEAIGVLPVDAGEEAIAALVTRLSTFVEQNVVAYVDVSEIPVGASSSESRTARLGVKYFLRRELMEPETRAELALEAATLSSWSDLNVELSSEPQVVLELASGT